jgi:hypothetical protein
MNNILLILFLAFNALSSIIVGSFISCTEKDSNIIILKNTSHRSAGAFIIAHLIITCFIGAYMTLQLLTELCTEGDCFFAKVVLGLVGLVYFMGFVSALLFANNNSLSDSKVTFTGGQSSWNFIVGTYSTMTLVTQLIEVYFVFTWLNLP